MIAVIIFGIYQICQGMNLINIKEGDLTQNEKYSIIDEQILHRFHEYMKREQILEIPFGHI